MTQLHEIKVSLSPNQKKNLSNAYHKKETIVLRLTKDALSGNDTLLVPQNIAKRLAKNRQMKKGMDIKLAKTSIRKQVGGSLLSTVLSLGKTFAPTLAKTLGLSALAGLASEGASQVVKKISGKGVQTGGLRNGSHSASRFPKESGFLIPQNKISQLITYKHLLTDKQKRDILNALQTGSGVHIKSTKVQQGGFLGTLLASVGIPLALEAIKKITGRGQRQSRSAAAVNDKVVQLPQSRLRQVKTAAGAPQMGQPKRRQPKNGGLVPYRSPPFIGSWPDQTIGMGQRQSRSAAAVSTVSGKKKNLERQKKAKACF